MSNVLRVVVKDAESSPVPDAGDDSTVSPDTGRFTISDTNIKSPDIDFATILPVATFGLVLLSVIIILITKIHHRKHESNFKIKANIKKILCVSFILCAIFCATNIITKFNGVEAINETLNIATTDTTINVTKETEANYVTALAEITLNEATAAGYDLYVYAPNGNELKLESSTQEEAILSVESDNSALASNTYGVTALNDIDAADEIWNPISESEDSPLLIISHTEATNIGDKINFYYGVLVDQDLPAGTYTAEIEYKAVPHYYTITFDPNEGSIDNPTKPIVAGATLGDLPTPTRTNYVFDGWYTDPTNGEEVTATTVPTRSITYYAHWSPSTITFTAGDNIEVIIVADSSNKYKPFYATTGTPVVFTQPAVDTKYIVTVVPKANYKLSGWSGNLDGFTNSALLTTTYFVPNSITSSHISLTATGETGTYTAMQNLSTTNCSTNGTNVTDTRDGKSYTITKFGNYCYMLSNLRLDNTTDGTTARILTSADSDITPNSDYTSFTMPIENWNSTYQNYYCKPIMKTVDNEYYYNWYAAIANPYDCPGPNNYDYATAIADAKALGSICPAGWSLPNTVMGGNINYESLITNGIVILSQQINYGDFGYLWFSSRDDNYGSYSLRFNGVDSELIITDKTRGLSVRCLHSL